MVIKPLTPWINCSRPRRMLVLLLYSYSVGVFSSRKIMQRCETDVAFRVIVGKDIPNFRRIAEFRKRHLQHMQALVLQVLVLCRETGLLKIGTKIALRGLLLWGMGAVRKLFLAGETKNWYHRCGNC